MLLNANIHPGRHQTFSFFLPEERKDGGGGEGGGLRREKKNREVKRKGNII